jgi:hypothetical protein
MRLIVPLVFAYDAERWAHERGIVATDACADFAAVLADAVDDGTLTAALDTALPVLRGHITARPVDVLDPTTRDGLLRRLRQARDPTRIRHCSPNSAHTSPDAAERSIVAGHAGSSSTRWSGTTATS